MKHPKGDAIGFIIPFTGVDADARLGNGCRNRQLEDGNKAVFDRMDIRYDLIPAAELADSIRIVVSHDGKRHPGF